YNDPVAIALRQTQQFVAYRATDHIYVKAVRRCHQGITLPSRSTIDCDCPVNEAAYQVALDMTCFTYRRVSVKGMVSAKMAPSSGWVSESRQRRARLGPAL